MNVSGEFDLYGKFEIGLSAGLTIGAQLTIQAVATMNVLDTDVGVSGFLRLNVPWSYVYCRDSRGVVHRPGEFDSIPGTMGPICR